jgi:hypothetical protein
LAPVPAPISITLPLIAGEELAAVLGDAELLHSWRTAGEAAREHGVPDARHVVTEPGLMRRGFAWLVSS